MDKDTIYNQLLVLQCQQGSKEAWEELVRRWNDRLFYYIRRMVCDEQNTWQILQETWLHVIQGLGKLNCPESLPKWLYCICRRQIVNHYRRHYKEAELHEQITKQNTSPPDTEMDQFDNAEQTHWGLGRLRPVFREVLTLFFLQDLSIEEIADVLGVPAGTVKSRMYYARKQLRNILEDSGNE